MMNNKKLCVFANFILLLAIIMNTIGVVSISAAENTYAQVTATASASTNQGNSGYCYVYISSLEALSSLSVTVYYDSDKIKVDSGYVYNSVSCTLCDKAVGDSNVQFSYIFDGNGAEKRTQLFYFKYTVLSNAEVGDSYFDIVVNEAYDSSLNALSVSGSRCPFTIAEKVITKTCSIYSTSAISTSVGEEFELSYRFSTYKIASGSFSIHYDPTLFCVTSVTNGGFCDNKLVDVNTDLAGTVYFSFVGTEYKSNTNLITVKFKTLQNVSEESTIKMTATELYDLERTPISCSGYITKANILLDESYTEDAPDMSLKTEYDGVTDKLTLVIKLDKDSKLGAGDFVLNFDSSCLTFVSATKGFAPAFFNINNKMVAEGVLKFSIISLSDIMDEQVVLDVTFDVTPSCEGKTAKFELNGSGLTDSLTNPILLNFVDANITLPPNHSETEPVIENKIDASCTDEGSYDSVIYCSVCSTELSRETVTIAMRGHNYATESTIDIDPTCTEAGICSRHCLRCDSRIDVNTIPPNGHVEGEWIVDKEATSTDEGSKHQVCSVCGNTIRAEVIPKLPAPIGDVNNDKTINSDDAIYLLRHTLNPAQYPCSQQCDFDGNGVVSSDDAIYLLRYTLQPDKYPLNH